MFSYSLMSENGVVEKRPNRGALRLLHLSDDRPLKKLSSDRDMSRNILCPSQFNT